MAGAKLVVIYPMPTDVRAFERLYLDEHMPMAAPAMVAGGATKAVLTRMTGSPAGPPPFHRMIEVHFPSHEVLQACAASAAAQEVVAHAFRISTGGPPTVLIAEEHVINLQPA
jgi:uncharacterized protein (TIGR02118 family)